MRRCWIAIIVPALLAGCGGGSGSPTSPTSSASPSSASRPSPLVVLSDAGQVGDGMDLLVDTDRRQQAWISQVADGLRAVYPSGQQWGFLGAVLVGPTAPGSRPGRDLSAYAALQIDLRGQAGGETVQVGIKDTTDPDDGTETRKTVVVTANWQTFTYALSDFRTADLKRLYLLFEVVFNGTAGQTVFVRNVRYVS